MKIENGGQLLSAKDKPSPTTSALASFVINECPAAIFVMAEMQEHIINLLAINATIIITDTHLATGCRLLAQAIYALALGLLVLLAKAACSTHARPQSQAHQTAATRVYTHA